MKIIKVLSVFIFLFFSITSFASFSAREFYKKGQTALKKHHCYQAADYFKQALAKNPYYKNAFAGAGESYYCMQNYIEARKYYEKALYYSPNKIHFLLRLADIKIKSSGSPKEYLGAEFYLHQAFKKEPRNSKVLMAYGDYYFQLGKLEKALEFYEKGKKSDNNFLAYLKIAKIYRKWGNKEKAHETLLKAENQNSMDYRTTFEMGKFFLETRDLDRAKRYLELTLKFHPQFRQGLFKLIEFYILRKNYPEAIQKINELLKLDPENPILYYNMGICYEQMGRFEDAVEFILKGQKYDFSDEALRIKAEEIVVKNLPLGHPIRKKLAAFYHQGAEIAYEKDQLDKAVLFYKRSLRINPLSVKSRKKLAQVFREKGWIDLFLLTLKAGLFVNPKNQELKDLIALNQQFLWKTLSHKEKINQYKLPSFFPELYVGDIVASSNNTHFHFKRHLKEILIEGLINQFSLNVKEIKPKELNKLSKRNQLWLRMRFTENNRKITLEAELIALATGNIFKRYQVTRYGNNRVLQSIIELSREIKKDVLSFGKILSIRDDTAIINIGRLQNVKAKDRFIILKSRDVIDDYFSGNIFKKQFIIGEAEVLETDEHIARVKLYKSHAVVFNLININDIVMVKKEKVNAKKKK